MNLKNYFFLALIAVFSFSVNAQEVTPNVPMQANSSVTITPEHIPSIASRMADIPAFVNVVKEAQDKRSLGNTIVIGKDRQSQDDYFVRNRNESEQSVRVMPPTLMFDAYSSNSQPTDPSLAVGPNHVIVVFNTGYSIYDKSGNLLAGPFAPNPSIFPNSGCCDLTASYDAAADRWVLSFLGSGAQVAVSDGPDPINDGWYNYNASSVNDYQKLSVWSDGYYMTDNTGSANKVYALERNEMLAGNPAQIIGFSLPGLVTSGFHSVQAVNVSDANMPADGGAPFIYMQDDAWAGVSSDHIKLWTLDMNWGAGNGTMSAATELPAVPFISVFDNGQWQNFTQPGGSTLDALQATIMNQAQFRKMGTHNSMLFNFVVDADATGGKLGAIRWYELRQTGDNQPWSIYQEGTYTAPDGKHAWNASLIMDGSGNIGMGYTSMAGPTTPNPTDHRLGSFYTGRFSGDPINSMTVVEEVINVGNGNIPGNRYGDYSKIDIDPSDDATFWFIDEYFNSGRKGVVGAFMLEPNTTVDDIGATSISSPVDGPLTANEDITINIRNFGINDINNPELQYTVNGGSAVVENYGGTLAAGATESFTFSVQADLSVAGDYTIVARTNLGGDSNPANDEVTKVVTSGIIICNPVGDCSFGDGFTNVTIQDINNDSGCEGYADFTDQEAGLALDSTYDLTVTTGYGDQNVRVWIDFNDDGTFSNDETVVPNFVIAEGEAAGTHTETVDLTIPAGANQGAHRMRVKSNWQAPVPDDACEETQYGETEDYTANIGDLATEDQDIVAAELMVLTLANNQFDISLTTEFDGVASIVITNILGQTLGFNNIEKEGNSYNYKLDMSYADAGVYFIKMGDNNSKTYKTVKIIVK